MTDTRDIDTLTGPAADVEHCGKPMRWKGSSVAWDGKPGHGHERIESDWECDCGATLRAIVRVPA